ncbi:MAG: GNAT family N-acetyltransferase [Oscillospiraceae bacterium]
MTIEKMTIADYDEVYDLWINTKGMGLNNLDDSREEIEKFLERNPETCFTAKEEGRVIGVIIAGHDGRRGYIYHTAVLQSKRNKGVGTALVENALAALKREGINKVALVVFDRNENGNSFWERKGFTVRDDLVYRNKALTDIVRIDT